MLQEAFVVPHVAAGLHQPPDWQRHHAYLAQLLGEGARLNAIVPGMTWHGEDIGRWLATQLRGFDHLGDDQRCHLDQLDVNPVRARKATANAVATITSGR
ncbi:hypothetical protein ACFV2B_35015 [Streptomyces lavendulae]|uniref:hypothetical protein n=2 Tax=Streptomyces TaxID=1883 RepID=UPI0036CDC6E8